MDDIIATLQSLLRHNFHVTATDTARHDQWFKRAYQSWAAKDKELLLLAPRVSRTEWAPDMLQFSAQLALHIRNLAAAERQRLDASFPPRDDKLFPDSVLDEPSLMCPLDQRQAPALSPRVQRGDWWPGKDLVDLAYVGKALLEHEQTAALVRVAQMRGVAMKEAADTSKHKRDRWRRSTEPCGGWGTLVDEALLIFFFAIIVGTFPDELLTEKAKYTSWLPYGELLSGLQPPERFVEALRKRPGGGPKAGGLRSASDLRPHAERCVRVLAAADVLREACHLPAVDWPSRISSAMLYFVGFEAWNRAREGQTYLHCHLNTTKDGRWLAHGLGAKGEAAVVVAAEEETRAVVGAAKLVRPRDPLRLREPRVDPVCSDEDGDEEDQTKLDELERAEAAYGAKRSTKYQRRRAGDEHQAHKLMSTK
ncbi:hypothetical protein LEL_04640 [Akanthomyces lecanii RCEF 1005]|uniref:Uncharacterized protein n=1 Tax=Akanthomyces lecanii RCEF 1005 TaxID=1081108 RepID=A0A168HIE8_CORDF|nr:hypothetical protein LEL_04640 [Akanthomyces lecanii RCEF 1005]